MKLLITEACGFDVPLVTLDYARATDQRDWNRMSDILADIAEFTENNPDWIERCQSR